MEGPGEGQHDMGSATKAMGRFILRTAVMVEVGRYSFCLQASRGLSWTERVGLPGISTKDRARTNVRQTSAQDDTNQSRPEGGNMETNYICFSNLARDKR